MPTAESLFELDRNHHVHGQTNLRQHQQNGPAAMVVEGHGVYIRTDDGRELIDGFSGLGCASLGYHNDRLAEAAKRQMDTLPFAPTFYGRSHPKVARLAARLVGMTPVPMDRVMFQCSGSEANDAMIKFLWYRNIARGQPHRRKLISLWKGYYGNTVAAVSLSGQPHMHQRFGLPMDEFLKLSTPNYYRFHRDGESEREFSARMAQEFETRVLEAGPDHIAAFVAEPMQSGGGAILPPSGYWDEMQAVIRKYDIHFHVDEVVCGFGRTGHWWGSEAFNLKPDSISCAKALTAAFFPLSALIFKEDFYQDMMHNSDEVGVLGHGFTYSGHPVGAAVALEALDIYEEMDLIGRVREVSGHFLDGCHGLMDHPLVGDARGIGLFCGIELVRDKQTREQFDPKLRVGQRVQDAAHAEGLYLRSIPPDRISFMPPLVIQRSEIDIALGRLKRALDRVWNEVR